MEPETWLPIKGFQGYFVSNLGNVRGPKKLRKLQLRPDGYLSVDLYIGGISYQFLVHILVCTAFHGPTPFKGALCLHADDIGTHNNASNLRWGTYKDNAKDRDVNGGTLTGERCSWAKLSKQDVLRIKQMYREGKTQFDIASSFDIQQGTVSQILSGKSWRNLSVGV